MAYYFLNFALSDAILKLERSREFGLFQAVDCLRTDRKREQTGTRAHFRAMLQGLDLVVGHHVVPEFWRGCLKKGFVHISAQRVPYSGARTPNVNITHSSGRNVS